MLNGRREVGGNAGKKFFQKKWQRVAAPGSAWQQLATLSQAPPNFRRRRLLWSRGRREGKREFWGKWRLVAAKDGWRRTKADSDEAVNKNQKTSE
jgi:hypothetical protein